MPKLRLHLDADASSKVLEATLRTRGHDVTRTPNEWIEEDASDEIQLLRASERQRCIFTFNVPHFKDLALKHPDHYGIIVGEQHYWTLSALIAALDRVLRETDAEDLTGQMRWLNEWRVR